MLGKRAEWMWWIESTSIIMEDEGMMEKQAIELPRVTQGNFAEIISMLFSQEMNCEHILSLLTQNVREEIPVE